jgi:hypothetical protein
MQSRGSEPTCTLMAASRARLVRVAPLIGSQLVVSAAVKFSSPVSATTSSLTTRFL